MSTLDHFKEGVERVWNTIGEGWYDLSRRAGHALTHFTPARDQDEDDDAGLLATGSRWGLLVADVRDDHKNVTVRVEAPGMDADDFDIRVDGDTLTVRGEKRVEREDTAGGYRISECAYGRFRRDIALPAAVSDDRVNATYKRGVLKIVLPKTNAAASRRVPVRQD
ncbi:MAG: Hsp20/alpha crystallin family protein [Gammaproteobacteria bacterium]